MTLSNNTGNIYKTLEKAVDILKSDIRKLVENSELLMSDIDRDDEDKCRDIVDKNNYILNKIKSMSQSVSIIDELIAGKILPKDEANVIMTLLDELKKYGMLDMSYGTKGKITIDLKHCSEIEEL